jgi:hypothetical protein
VKSHSHHQLGIGHQLEGNEHEDCDVVDNTLHLQTTQRDCMAQSLDDAHVDTHFEEEQEKTHFHWEV